MRIPVIIFLLSISIHSSGQFVYFLNKAVKQIENKEIEKAELLLLNLIKKNPNKAEAYYNLGNLYFSIDSFDKAKVCFTSTVNIKCDSNLKAKSYFNLGNTYIKKSDFKSAINAYTQSLIFRINDPFAIHNLCYALKKQEQQQNQQNQDKQNQDKQNQENKDNKEDKQNQPDEKQEQKQDKPEKSNELTKRQADILLDALKNQEKQLREQKYKELQKNHKQKSNGKDW